MFYRNQLIPTGQLSNVGYPIMTNVSRSYRTGVEVSFGLKPVKMIDWRFNLTLSRNKIIDFTQYYTDYNTSDWSSEYKSNNLGTVDIAYSPPVTGSSDIALDLMPWLRLHIISKYVGKQYFDNTMSSERMLSPYFVNSLRFDINPAVKTVRNTEFQFVINNLLNAEYESNAYGGNWYEDGIEKTWAYYFPQAGINYMVRLAVKF
jgi:iron complex outermembrane receptor protein